MLLLPQKALRSSVQPIRATRPLRLAQKTWRWSRTSAGATKQSAPLALVPKKKPDGPSTDLGVILGRLSQLALPYWQEEKSARWKLAGVVGLTLATTGVSVVFNFLGRDFFTALSDKNETAFYSQLVKYLGGFALGIPVFVFKSYFQSKLALEWRQWMTERLLAEYLSDRTFYGLQQSAEVDNPDQRISSDVANFTDTALGLSLTLLNAAIDLVSFSGILFTIYPPLFAALVVYSVGGTAASVALGKNLVTLNFNQEAREADFRYGLVRVRENAESIAFYGGDQDERALLKLRLQAAVENYLGLLTASRNLDFFTSFYRYLIQLLPAAVVAPLFFQGKIDFGVINQSQSAFNHILNDVSLVIYQIEALAGFSAVVDRLGEFDEAVATRRSQQQQLAERAKAGAPADSDDAAAAATSSSGGVTPAVVGGDDETSLAALPGIELRFQAAAAAAAAAATAGTATASTSGSSSSSSGHHDARPLLQVRDLTVATPRGRNVLLRGLDLDLTPGQSLLVMGPSGAGKTSLLRAVAGLWSDGRGAIDVRAPRDDVMFLPQRPYMVLGSLRDQALYPRRHTQQHDDATGTASASASAPASESPAASTSASAASSPSSQAAAPLVRPPSDSEILAVLELVQLGHLVTRYAAGAEEEAAGSSNGNGASTTSSSAPASRGSAAHASPSALPPAAAKAALDTTADWAASLSLGEQQRLGWARLLLARPRPALALLDEATSALDQETEARLYKVLAQSGISYVSVGHRSTLRDFHSALLQLRPDGAGGVTWEVRPLEAAAAQVAAAGPQQ
ncbi:hypothetical protein HYH02_006168 [Chlamydomonas schloesseri]|uniref:ABC transporter domain-containing protein n=1 Tax=Chlamydomonas schloesseri TaxID=2026947 RepID=A0A835WK10_9CHLO|nr:hypothetical protein HYH02_006168 [Chlamydomonas schloesseri]|eukprot:KAG2448817.1 hypothetical protein HYH02_006168 [Chlamydomonas schloesseri]